MGIGIVVCGLNGSGKSTLGKALAEKIGFHFIDNEALFFPQTDAKYLYSAPRSREEADIIFDNEIKSHDNFVFAAVKGNYGKEILPIYHYAILIEVPKNIRMQRIKERSLQKFGSRMMVGGDLYEHEQAFFDMVNARDEHYVEDWVQTLYCPIIRVNGTRAIHDNLAFILEKIKNDGHLLDILP